MTQDINPLKLLIICESMHQRISQLPSRPAIYALISGRGQQRAFSYVGIADELKRRVVQHIERRNSSITTGSSAVSLDPEKITEVIWWEDATFSDRACLEAAEEIASEILKPTLRSRAKITERAQEKLKDEAFTRRINTLLRAPPIGRIELPTFEDLLERVDRIEDELEAMKAKIGFR
jgi:hypothetical protein